MMWFSYMTRTPNDPTHHSQTQSTPHRLQFLFFFNWCYQYWCYTLHVPVWATAGLGNLKEELSQHWSNSTVWSDCWQYRLVWMQCMRERSFWKCFLLSPSFIVHSTTQPVVSHSTLPKPRPSLVRWNECWVVRATLKLRLWWKSKAYTWAPLGYTALWCFSQGNIWGEFKT